jgi:hypothetical protein
MEEVKGLIQQLTTRMDRWDTERGRNYRQNKFYDLIMLSMMF